MFTIPEEIKTKLFNGEVTFESEAYYSSVDLISEGPIEGFCDKNGQTLNYIARSFTNNQVLEYGIYYNDVPLRDVRNKLLNFSSSKSRVFIGNERNNFFGEASLIYDYKQRIYNIRSTSSIPGLTQGTGISVLNSQSNIIPMIESSISSEFAFNHKVQNKYAKSLTIIFSIESLSSSGKNGVGQDYLSMGVKITNLTKRTSNYCAIRIFKAITSPSVFPLDIVLDKEIEEEILVTVVSLSKNPAASETITRSFYVDAIAENINYKFSYPYSAISQTEIGAKHFGSIPTRSFDCKLLKIKVPDNYDGEAREYDGDWSGEYSKSLKWTDNPAWIFYDLCLNSRYGLTAGVMKEKDISKWETLKISKFCDELVKTNAPSSFAPDYFSYLGQNKIRITTNEDLPSILEKYPIGSLLFLYDTKDRSGAALKNYKKVILNIESNGTEATLTLCNDFGPRKFLENDKTGLTLRAFSEEVTRDAFLNKEDEIKKMCVNWINGEFASYGPTDQSEVSLKYKNTEIFQDENVFSGFCLAKKVDERPFLEHRFSSNMMITEQSEGLKVLTDVCSIFRGIFYFQNGFLNITSDVKLPVSYIFSNSNVKDGLFSYSSGASDIIFSSVKITYSDAHENFQDRTIVVEDLELIRKYGIIEKEILGFGVTSKSQAQRIGKWFIATNKLESQIVSFTTGIEGGALRPGNIVRIADSLKNRYIFYGKITGLHPEELSFCIDREIDKFCLGCEIKVYSSFNFNDAGETEEMTFKVHSVNSSMRKIFVQDLNNKFSFLKSGVVFAIYLKEGETSNDLYRIISIVESEANEYGVSCMKYDESKFNLVENDEYESQSNNQNKQITFSNQSSISPIVLPNLQNYIESKNISYLTVLNEEYKYKILIEQESFTSDVTSLSYQECSIDFNKIFEYIDDDRAAGILCFISKNAKSLKFKVSKDSSSVIKILLGEKSGLLSIDFYAYDKNEKLFSV